MPGSTDAAKHDLKGKSAVLLIKERSHAVHSTSLQDAQDKVLVYPACPGPPGMSGYFTCPAGHAMHEVWGAMHGLSPVWATGNTPTGSGIRKGASIRNNEENGGLSDSCIGAHQDKFFPPSPGPEFLNISSNFLRFLWLKRHSFYHDLKISIFFQKVALRTSTLSVIPSISMKYRPSISRMTACGMKASWQYFLYWAWIHLLPPRNSNTVSLFLKPVMTPLRGPSSMIVDLLYKF